MPIVYETEHLVAEEAGGVISVRWRDGSVAVPLRGGMGPLVDFAEELRDAAAELAWYAEQQDEEEERSRHGCDPAEAPRHAYAAARGSESHARTGTLR